MFFFVLLESCFFAGALYGGLMLASSMVIKTPAPGYKVPGLDAGTTAEATTKAAPVVQVLYDIVGKAPGPRADGFYRSDADNSSSALDRQRGRSCGNRSPCRAWLHLPYHNNRVINLLCVFVILPCPLDAEQRQPECGAQDAAVLRPGDDVLLRRLRWNRTVQRCETHDGRGVQQHAAHPRYRGFRVAIRSGTMMRGLCLTVARRERNTVQYNSARFRALSAKNLSSASHVHVKA